MYKNRRKKLLKNFSNDSILLVFSGYAPIKSEDQTHPFFGDNNFYYLTGIKEENYCLILSNDKEIIYKPQYDPKLALWVSAPLDNKEVSKISSITDIRDIKKFDEDILNLLKNKNLYLDLEPRYPYTLANQFKLKYPNLNPKSFSNELYQQRLIKDKTEIKYMQKAIEITNQGLKNVMNKLKPSKYEYELEGEYNYILSKYNVETSFDTIAASGKNATTLHYVDNNSKIPDNSLMLFDLGVYYKGYASDISRTYPTNAKFSKREKQIYEIVLKANKESIKFIKPGITMKEFNDFGKQILIDECLKIGLINKPEEINKYYYHSLGHPLGLDVHDVGGRDFVLKPGMVITCEPGLYIKEENIGIRIEDDILVTKTGSKNLSKCIIKEVDEIESFMRKQK